MRSGVIAKKVGMTRVFNDKGEHVPVTVLQLDNCQVVAQRTVDRDGYTAVQLGAGSAKVKNTPRALRGHFAKANVAPKRRLAEFRVSPENLLDVGAVITADHFVDGQYVDVTGVSIGKGFAGGMKRHGFSGLHASHGVSVSHRALGSTGQNQDPGKVFKGKKMPGQMGNTRVTTQNLEIVRTDSAEGLILVKGAVPGAKGGWLLVQDATKKLLPEDAPTPAAVRMPEGAAEESEPPEAEAAGPEGVVEEMDATEATPAEAKVEAEADSAETAAETAEDAPDGAQAEPETPSEESAVTADDEATAEEPAKAEADDAAPAEDPEAVKKDGGSE